MWMRTPQNRRALNARGRLYEFADTLIEAKGPGSNGNGDMLDSMLEATRGDGDYEMTDEELRANIVTFIIAGYTTTASAMGWMAYELMRNRDEAETVREESVEVWEQKDPDEILDELEYTKAAFDETLRLYPTAPWIARSNHEELQLGDFTLPANTPVVMTPYLMHYNLEYYEEPEEFRPERFLRDDPPDHLTYVPFSVGAHQCIGREIALMEGPLILSKLFSECHFETTLATPQEATIHTAVNIEPEEDMFVLFEPDS
jgi:cytochrome P450